MDQRPCGPLSEQIRPPRKLLHSALRLILRPQFVPLRLNFELIFQMNYNQIIKFKEVRRNSLQLVVVDLYYTNWLPKGLRTKLIN